MTVMLELRGLTKRFGALRAVDGVDLAVKGGEIAGLIGPNGSGKTTLFNCVTGFLRPSSGQILWHGTDIGKWPPHRIARAGIVRTFQQPMVFSSATTRENVEIALCSAKSAEPADGHRPTSRAAEILDFCALSRFADAPAPSLSYGNRRRLGVAVALAAQPKMLLLDEPAAGLNDDESAQLGDLLRRVRDAGVTLVVVDHDMTFLLPLAERVIVMNSGRVIVEGTTEEVQQDRRVIEAYLGEKYAREHPLEGAADQD